VLRGQRAPRAVGLMCAVLVALQPLRSRYRMYKGALPVTEASPGALAKRPAGDPAAAL